jgi:hypothetical protein
VEKAGQDLMPMLCSRIDTERPQQSRPLPSSHVFLLIRDDRSRANNLRARDGFAEPLSA